MSIVATTTPAKLPLASAIRRDTGTVHFPVDRLSSGVPTRAPRSGLLR